VKEFSTRGVSDEQIIEMKAVLKRKFEYYVTMKIRDAESENIVENSNIRLVNLSTKELDSIGVNTSGELDIKLDSEADYLLLAFKNDKYGEVMVDKPGKKKVSSVRYTTLHLSESEEKKISLIALDSLGNPYSNKEVIVKDLITGKEQQVISTDKGEMKFSLPRSWFFRIYYHDRKYFYDSLTLKNTGYVLFK
jgi:hypothetical protein